MISNTQAKKGARDDEHTTAHGGAVFTLTIIIRARVRATLGVARVALGQVHLCPGGGPTVRFQPLDGTGETILALGGTQVSGTLRHTLKIPIRARPEGLVSPIRRLQIRQHSVPPGQRVRGQPNGRSTFLGHHRLVLHPDERRIVVLHEAAVELQRAAAGGVAERAELSDRTRHAARALVVAEVAAALEEAVDGVVGGDGEGEVVVVGEGGGVDERGEERVDGGLVGRTRRVLGLGATAEDEGVDGGGGGGGEVEEEEEEEKEMMHGERESYCYGESFFLENLRKEVTKFMQEEAIYLFIDCGNKSKKSGVLYAF